MNEKTDSNTEGDNLNSSVKKNNNRNGPPSSHSLVTNGNSAVDKIGRGRASFRISFGRGKAPMSGGIPSISEEGENICISQKYLNDEEDKSQGYGANERALNSVETLRPALLQSPNLSSPSVESIVSGVGSITVSRGRGRAVRKPPPDVVENGSAEMTRSVNSKQLRRPNSLPPINASFPLKSVTSENNKPLRRPISLPPSNPSERQFHCHRCNKKMKHVTPDLSCQLCESAFVEEVDVKDNETKLENNVVANGNKEPEEFRCHICKEKFKAISHPEMKCPFCKSDFLEIVSEWSDTFQSDDEQPVTFTDKFDESESNSSAAKYFCHQCKLPVLVTSPQVLQCPLCKSGAIEESLADTEVTVNGQTWSGKVVEDFQKDYSVVEGNGNEGWTDWKDLQSDATVSYKTTHKPIQNKVNFIDRQRMLMEQCKVKDETVLNSAPSDKKNYFGKQEKEPTIVKRKDQGKAKRRPFSNKETKKLQPLFKNEIAEYKNESLLQNEDNLPIVKDDKETLPTKRQMKRARKARNKKEKIVNEKGSEDKGSKCKDSEHENKKKSDLKCVVESESTSKSPQSPVIKSITELLKCDSTEECLFAIEILRNALNAGEEYVSVRLQLAELSINLHNYNGALKDSLAARELEPQNDQVNKLVVRCGILVGDVVTARMSLDRIAEVELDDPNWEEELSIVEEALKNGRACHALANHVGAARQARLGLVYARHHVELLLILAKSLMMMGRLADCLGVATKLLNIIAQSNGEDVQARAEVLYLRGVVFHRLGQTDKAIEQFEILFREDSAYPGVRSKLDGFRRTLDTKKQCERLCRQAEILIKGGDPETALLRLEQAMSLPSFSRDTVARILHLRSQLLDQLTRHSEAEAALADILDLEMNQDEWRLEGEMKGNVLAERGKYLAAKGEWEEAIDNWEEAGRFLGGFQVLHLLIWAKNNLLGNV